MNRNRILGWNGWPTQMGQAADFVIGQGTFTSTGAAGNSKGVFNNPTSLACEDGKLVVSDMNNHRVLIWNTAPTANVAADVVVGQSTASAAAANGAGGVAAGGFSTPLGVALVPRAGGTAFPAFLADFFPARFMRWPSALPIGGFPG
jgi:hypothetical protein